MTLESNNMENKDYAYISKVTNRRLAEMLREHNKWRRGIEPPYDKVGVEPPFDSHELGAIIDEAARRLEETFPHNHNYFNDEQFDI